MSNAISRQLNHTACSARGDDHVARGRRCRLKIRTRYRPLALFAWQRDDAIPAVLAKRVTGVDVRRTLQILLVMSQMGAGCVKTLVGLES